MPAEQLMTHLSEYLDALTHVIMDNHGTVDKYIGDAIMAFWGAPLPCADHAYLACRSARRCQQALTALNRGWHARGLPPMPTRIGLNTGACVVGNVGSSDRMNYTVLGDSVNLASRLEGVNKVYGTRVILSEATHLAVADRVLARPLDLVIVKGRSEPTRILELVALLEDDPDEALRDQVARYERAFARYLDRAWDEAIALLEPLQAEVGPDDPVVVRLLARCRELGALPPEDDRWRCTRLSSK
jgi:adenylate cyclase